ncbi:MAG TPA: primosomal protein N' [Vicinamibacterales bacterium]|nr:primosomal protein N' [Vicinamibacterales bacterium]
MRLIQVAVPVPALDLLTYSVPDGLPLPAAGARVLVPLGTRTVTGLVVSADPAAATPASDPAASAKDVIDVLDDEPFLPEAIVGLSRWLAEYYACGVGEAIATAMPPRAWIESARHAAITDAGEARRLNERGVRRDILDRLTGGRVLRVSALARQSRGALKALATLEHDGFVTRTQPLRGQADASRTRRFVQATAQALEPDRLAGLRLGVRQRAVLERLSGAPDGLAAAALAEAGADPAALRSLARLGLVTIERRRVERDPFTDAAPAAPPTPLELTSEQRAALDSLRQLSDARSFAPVLLHGVTGSGKTELYLRLARHVLASGRRVLVMVPEIALTPATAAVFRAAFGERIAIQHSGLSDGERYDQWQRIRRGAVDVVVGTRSAVFAPLADLGLVVVDEEHDGSYKQEETPRYHARDVAVVRGRDAGAMVVLGSATPSMESFRNARSGRYRLITLERRVLDRPLAQVRLVDMRAEYAAEGPDVILSAPLREALTARVARGEQAIVLLNRRGFASAVFCRQCGDTLECPNCSVSLTVHRAARRARCHYCNYSTAIPRTCGHCAGAYLEQLGFGTERVEAELTTLLPHARVGRVDRDTIRRRGAIVDLLGRFAARQLDVLVGTQMIAKGHDFPQVTLVGVISADVGLGLADFRAAERTFQLLTQVAGRAGRGALAGEAIVQTLHPDHYSIRHACLQEYARFYDDELKFRTAMRYPPGVALVNVIVKARTREAAMADAGSLAGVLRSGTGQVYRVLGPAPAPLGRLKGEHRAQLFLKGSQRKAMREALVAALNDRPDLKRRTIVDVDPMSVL